MSDILQPRTPWPFPASAHQEKPTAPDTGADSKPCTDERMCTACYTGQGECENPPAEA